MKLEEQNILGWYMRPAVDIRQLGIRYVDITYQVGGQSDIQRQGKPG